MTELAGIHVLAVTPDADGWPTLRDVANKERWTVTWAQSADSAVAALAGHRIAVAICDRDLPGDDWRLVLKRIAKAGHPVCTVLASSVSDVYLWKEVAHNSGFDVLRKPFQRDALVRTVNLAAVAWQARLGPKSRNHALPNRVQN